jgi:hydrogenase nickel incorporation protein HypA/HybF
MHELSIAVALIDMASEEATRLGARRVRAVHLRIGALSGVVPDALSSAFELAAEKTMLEGALLRVENVPVTIFCGNCDGERRVSYAYDLVCPDCGSASPDVVGGRELEMCAMEIEERIP